MNNRLENGKLTNSLQQNINILKKIFKNNDTIIYRYLENRNSNELNFCAIFSDVMVDKDLLHEAVINPLISTIFDEDVEQEKLLYYITKKVITSSDVDITDNVEKICTSIMYGDTLIFTENQSRALIINTKGFQTRSIGEPETEMTIRGPRDGFTESIAVNVSLLSRRIKNPKLKFMFREIGTQTKTKVCICYIEDIASKKILKELEARLNKIDSDQVLYVEEIEECIKDSPLSAFKTIGNSERPDVVAGKLLEGGFAIISDGAPYVLMLPFIFIEYFQSADDYSNNYIYSSINRLIRFLAFFLGTSTPALYIAVTTFHQELVPTRLILSISSARQGVPFPTVVEAIIMLVGFDMLREAGTRLPKPVGQTISIVGALVLGDAAVNARLISAPMVIVVAVTGICSLLIPKMLGPFIITRSIFLLLASILGLYGYAFGAIGLFIYLTSMRSFGIPYMLYSSVVKASDIKDTVIRAPWWMMNKRPKQFTTNSRRKKSTRKE